MKKAYKLTNGKILYKKDIARVEETPDSTTFYLKTGSKIIIARLRKKQGRQTAGRVAGG
jgi:hypothetical protein